MMGFQMHRALSLAWKALIHLIPMHFTVTASRGDVFVHVSRFLNRIQHDYLKDVGMVVLKSQKFGIIFVACSSIRVRRLYIGMALTRPFSNMIVTLPTQLWRSILNNIYYHFIVIAATFETAEPLHFLRLNGHVHARQSTHSPIVRMVVLMIREKRTVYI